jgi:hypothetical protein
MTTLASRLLWRLDMNLVALSALLVGSLFCCVLGCSGSNPENPADTQSSRLDVVPTQVSATITLLDDAPLGISICARGSGLPPGSPVYLAYSGVPGIPAFTAGTSLGFVDQDGTYRVKDSSEVLVGDCSVKELTGGIDVTVYTSQDSSTPQPTPVEPGHAFAVATIPTEFWCSNGSGGMDFNGGCH